MLQGRACIWTDESHSRLGSTRHTRHGRFLGGYSSLPWIPFASRAASAYGFSYRCYRQSGTRAKGPAQRKGGRPACIAGPPPRGASAGRGGMVERVVPELCRSPHWHTPPPCSHCSFSVYVPPNELHLVGVTGSPAVGHLPPPVTWVIRQAQLICPSAEQPSCTRQTPVFSVQRSAIPASADARSAQ